MAKKKTEDDKDVKLSSEEQINLLLAEVEKEYGENVLIDGEAAAAISDDRRTVSISPAIDVITSRGFRSGSFIGVSGPPGTGKTSLALAIAASFQQLGWTIFYGKAEGRFEPARARQIQGLCLQAPKFYQAASIKDKVLSGQEQLSIYEKILKTVPKSVLVIDAISALVPSSQQTEGIEKESRGSMPKYISRFLDNVQDVVPINDSVVIGISHIISNTGAQRWEPKNIEKGAVRWKYQCDFRLEALNSRPWTIEGKAKPIGLITKWQCHKSPFGPPAMKLDSYFRFGYGPDWMYESFLYGKLTGLIEVKGAWFNFSYLATDKYKHLLKDGEIPKAQGEVRAQELLSQHPEWLEALRVEATALAQPDVYKKKEEDD